MALPSKDDVRNDVVTILTVFTGKKPNQIRDEHDLQKDLQLKGDRLNALAISLRGYIKQHNPEATLVAKEIKKKDTTVVKVVDLVFKRISGK
jgi:hypothetical protein